MNFVEMCCCFMGREYLDKVEQIGSEAAKEGRVDPFKTIKEIKCLLEKLGAEVKDHKRKSMGPS
jgi:hypothetical protein